MWCYISNFFWVILIAKVILEHLNRFKNGIEDNLEVLAKPRWPLDPKAPFLKGAGVKY